MRSILPIGMRIRHLLRSESNAFAPDSNEWVQKAIALFPAAAENAAAANTAPAATTAKISGTAAHAFFAPIAAIATTAAVAVGSVMFINAQPDFVSLPKVPLTATVEAVLLQGDIVFAGGETLQDNINPRSASAWAANEYGDMAAVKWIITSENGDETILAGEGGEVDGIYTTILKISSPGSYIMNFIMEDAIGGTYMVSRQFVIREEIDSAQAGEEHAVQSVIDD